MLNFNEWLKEEEFKLFEEIYTKESVIDVLKGAVGAGRGLFKAGHGFMTMGDEALAKMVGDGTKGRLKKGWSDFSGGLKDMFVGTSKQKQKLTIQPADDAQHTQTKTVEKPTAATKTVEKPTPSETWEDVAKKYNSATSEKERRAIQVRLAQIDPVKYQKALERAYKLKLRQHAMRKVTT